jgi:hypothetical protein
MTRTRSSRAAAKSRRRFLKTLALGSAAALVSATLPKAVGAADRPARGAAKPGPQHSRRAPAIEAEIAKQKKSTGDLLKTIRNYPLPPGSEMAFEFVPMRAPKRRGGRAAEPVTGGER